MPGMVEGVVLNDIGPEVGMDGLGVIVDYMKTDASFDDWDAVADYLRQNFPDLPARSAGDWLDIAHNTHRETEDGKIIRDWDPAIVRQFENALTDDLNLWPQFMALSGLPVLTVRGAKSAILSEKTLGLMAQALPAMAQVTVDDCGHPPSLSEPNVLEAIDAHLAQA